MLLYFAYGSNLNRAQMKRRCPDSHPLYPGWLRGYRLAFNRYSSAWQCGVADIVATPHHEVWGLIYEISHSDLKSLDHYEGYPNAYTRLQTKVQTKNSIQRDVWVYTVYEKGEFIAPKAAYLDIIKKAAAEYSCPEHYRDFLEHIPVDDT